ncbi:ribonuclease III [Thermodesulfobacteriota bacterium]
MDYKENIRIDLHIHSTASDGTLTPSEIITMAQELGLGAIAITDHDTLAGSKEAIALTMPATIEFVTGVEISARPIAPFDFVNSYHILGYFIHMDDPVLNQTLEELQQIRRKRNQKILQRLNNMGIMITMEDIRKGVDAGEVGRPHFATALLEKNIVHSINEAFDQYLGQGKPAYVDKQRLSCRKAIQIISEAGGVPVLAHPGLLNIDQESDLEALIVSLKEKGLKGVEVYYPEHSDQQVQQLLRIASSHDLLLTGGTDFHGKLKPELKMGIGHGALHVPYGLFEDLRQCAHAPDNISKLEKKLGYTFQDSRILSEAVRHSSFVNEQANPDMRDNERFEFLGDAVLSLVVGHILMERYPDLKEGDLTRLRSNMVNESQLAAIAHSLSIGSHILFGKGEFLTGGHRKNSILADTMEAIIAAIYLDGGYQAAYTLIEGHFSALFDTVGTGVHFLDYKSALQEVVQLQHEPAPEYRIIEENGPDHDKTFSVQTVVCNIQAVGKGKSKKAAEQDAARKVLVALKP